MNSTITQWAQLLPAGPRIDARDGRWWTFDPATVIAAFRANSGPLAVDYEHAQDLVAPKGSPAPAAGWIVAMEEREGSLWGNIEWTERAAQLISGKAYRYLSPSIRHDSARNIKALNGAGLVNRPALYLEPLDLANRDEDAAGIGNAIASRAQTYQQEQTALGRSISISQAVAAVTTNSRDEA
ncbi:hypothetical protein CQ054_07025 [Ochrobactrum sp. MYb29]|nr:hypothetical protein CQ054_07025 [Ochrobactrum sp. MYb29]